MNILCCWGHCYTIRLLLLTVGITSDHEMKIVSFYKIKNDADKITAKDSC